jgi:Ammonium Transporter Family
MANLVENCRIAGDEMSGQYEALECVASTLSLTNEVLNARMEDFATSLDIVFLLFASIVMFTMQAGFAMLCAGSVRRKNVQNTLLKNLLDACGCAVAFFICGKYRSVREDSFVAVCSRKSQTHLIFTGFAFAYGGTGGTISSAELNKRHPTTFIGSENFF